MCKATALPLDNASPVHVDDAPAEHAPVLHRGHQRELVAGRALHHVRLRVEAPRKYDSNKCKNLVHDLTRTRPLCTPQKNGASQALYMDCSTAHLPDPSQPVSTLLRQHPG